MVDETQTDPAAGKGRATPSRKQAEAARKQQMKAPVSRKDQRKREVAAREELRLKQRDALKNGDERYLPARDRGPLRRFTRDFVDRRTNVAEFLLPFLVAILVMTFLSGLSSAIGIAVTFVWSFMIVGTIFDEILLVRGLRKQLRLRFPGESYRGLISYAVLRSTQLRRFRLPKPQVARGAELSEHYR